MCVCVCVFACVRARVRVDYLNMFHSAPAHALNTSALVDNSALTVLLYDGLFGVSPAATGWQVTFQRASSSSPPFLPRVTLPPQIVESISPPESPTVGYRRHWGWDGKKARAICRGHSRVYCEFHFHSPSPPLLPTGAAMSAPWSM